jgi:6-phosphogluconate dehydrogenase
MQLGMIGLGRMGANMARRLLRSGHELVVLDRDSAAVDGVVAAGGVAARTLPDMVAAMSAPRHVWLMLPAGDVTEQMIAALADLLERDDTIIDGGNTYFKDDVRRARQLAERGVDYVDVGTSGGVHGLERGYCLMIGGEREVVQRLDPVFRSLAPGRGTIEATPGADARGATTAEDGYLWCGPAGSGHFVKMVHNGIEYGVMQAFAEGFDILRGASGTSVADEHRYELPLADIAEVWRRGSVLSSWLLDLTARALAEDPALARFSGRVADSGEGRWTVMTAVEEAVPADVITAALYTRFRSRQEAAFAEKLLSAMRFQFGGHVEPAPGS